LVRERAKLPFIIGFAFLPTQQHAVVEAVSKSAVRLPDEILRALGIDPADFHNSLAAKSDLSTQAQREAAKYKLRDADGTIKYPINDCSDVADAWKLRGSSNIPKDRVEAYVRRVASKLGCDGPWNDGKELLPDSPTNDWQIHTATLSRFTPLEEIEAAVLRRVAAVDLKTLAEKAAAETVARLQGRV
jgi:hypothetical protein